jgi:hypothetical protein
VMQGHELGDEGESYSEPASRERLGRFDLREQLENL